MLFLCALETHQNKEAHQNNMGAAAQELGLARSSLYRKSRAPDVDLASWQQCLRVGHPGTKQSRWTI